MPTDHYERFWAAAQEMEMPVSVHILTGFGYVKTRYERKGLERYRGSVNLKLAEIIDSLMDIIFSGVLERFPRLKIVLVENEIGWLPYVLEQWDYYFDRHRPTDPLTIDKLPTEYFNRQVFATFFNDAVGAHNLDLVGARQLHVVQRLPPRQLHLAALAGRGGPGPRPSAGRRARQAAAGQRRPAVQHAGARAHGRGGVVPPASLSGEGASDPRRPWPRKSSTSRVSLRGRCPPTPSPSGRG